MIGFLTGRIAMKASDHVVIDVNGVGYVVYCSEQTIFSLPPIGEIARVYTDLLVREDLLQLFGFSSQTEREWYRLLVTVQGVGSKAAMAILGALPAERIGRAITLGDYVAVKAAPGVGPKLAQRIVNELKDKAAMLMSRSFDDAPVVAVEKTENDAVVERFDAVPSPPQPQSMSKGVDAEAMSALENLGYDRISAAQAVSSARADAPDADLNTLIRVALKALAPKG